MSTQTKTVRKAPAKKAPAKAAKTAPKKETVAKAVKPAKVEKVANKAASKVAAKAAPKAAPKAVKLAKVEKTVAKVAKAPKAAKVVKAAPKAKKASKVELTEVVFSVYSPDSQKVEVAGEFNNWTPAAMTKGEQGVWTLKTSLAAGSYQYKFVFDRSWEIDQANPDRVPDGQGGENSVKNV